MENRNVREFGINGKTYKILLPSVRQCMILANRVIVLLGSTAASLGTEVTQNGMESFGRALGSIDPMKLDSLMMDAANMGGLSCEKENVASGIYFERHFNQYREDVYPVCMWAIWECIRDFLPHSLISPAFVQGVQEKITKALKSQANGTLNTGSEGQSGPDTVPGFAWKTAR